MDPGIYQGVSFAAYSAWPHLNGSTLRWAEKSMEHLQAALEGRLFNEDSPDKALGRAFHAKLLEPAVYDSQFVIASPCAGILKTGKRAGQACGNDSRCRLDGAWYCGVHEPDNAEFPADFVTSENAARVEQMAERVKGHRVVKLLRQHGGYECSLVWDGPENVRMKARLDKYIGPGGKCPATIVDLKKVALGRGDDASFSQSVLRYGYDVKAALYVDAVESLQGVQPVFIWVVVEDTYPFAINVISADDATLRIGRAKYRKGLAAYRAALESGNWLGYAPDIHAGGLSSSYIMANAHLLE